MSSLTLAVSSLTLTVSSLTLTEFTHPDCEVARRLARRCAGEGRLCDPQVGALLLPDLHPVSVRRQPRQQPRALQGATTVALDANIREQSQFYLTQTRRKDVFFF